MLIHVLWYQCGKTVHLKKIIIFSSNRKIYNLISQADVNTEIIFNCQMGRGRTTTGMVIATLFYLNRIGASGTYFISF